MKINVPLRRKDTEIETSPCMVEKTVELSADWFDHFSQNLLNHYDFILENTDCMYQDKDGMNHCLLVLGEGRDDGILVEAEGSSYARYSAFVPNARQLLRQEQRYEPALQSYCDRMQAAMNEIVQTAPSRQQNGMLKIPLSDFSPSPGEYLLDTAMLCEMLSGQPEFDTAELFEDEILMQMNPKYLPAEKKEYRPLSQEQADIICAKHILWLYDAGGEQADFSGYELSDLNLSHRNLNSALFNGALLSGTSFQESYLCFADFTGAKIENCNAKNIAADEAVFKNAVVRNCNFSGAFMEHCNFSGADLTGTTVKNARMQNACIDGATVPDTVFEQADFRNYSTDEQDWSEPSDPVLSM